MRLKSPIQFLFVLSISLFLLSSVHADAFKCVDKTGNIVFQDSACSDNEKQVLIEIQKSTSEQVSNSLCNSQCLSRRALCIAELGGGRRNTSKNLLLCEKTKEVCYLACANSSGSGQLETHTRIERSNYERELRRERSLKKAAKYKKAKEKRSAEWDLKYKNWNCQKYEKKLAKIKAKWEHKQGAGWTPKDEVKFLRKIENAEDEVTIECR